MIELNNWDEKYRNNPRPDDDLVALVLTKDADADDEEYWQPIGALQHRLPEVLERVSSLLRSGDEKARDAAATILGQNRRAAKWDVGRCVAILSDAISQETAARPLAAILHAFAHLHDENTIPIITAFLKHESADVRFAVTNALHGYENPAAIWALIELSADSDFDVRNWATFYLGSWIDTDSAPVRDALAARLHESDDEVLGEAIVGLARRADARCIQPLISILDRAPAEKMRDWLLAEEAVDAVSEKMSVAPDAIWLPVLFRAKQLAIGDQDGIQTAIEKCKSRESLGQSK